MNHCHDTETRVTVDRKLAITSAVFGVMVLVSHVEPMAALNQSLMFYLDLIWWAVLLGIFVGGMIGYFVPDGFIGRFLGRKRKTTLLYAVIAGFLMSACSHGILAIAMQLYKKGAGVPAVITFLLASPWANLPMTVLLFGFFGWRAALFVLGAMAIALTTGLAYMALDRAGLIEPSAGTSDAETVEWTKLERFDAGDAVRGVARAMLSLSNMVLWWILIGLMAAALIGAYVPQHLFMEYLGPDTGGLLLTLLFATVIEVCSEGTSPVAFELFNQTGALGNPFVFLMAGVATDYTEIGLLWSNIGRRTAIWLPIVTVPQILLLGFAFNYFVAA